MHAELMRRSGERPFDRLRDTRAAVRRAAAAIVRNCADKEAAAAEMMAHARRRAVREPPFAGFDEAMLDYTAARTWQGCALQLAPGIVPVQQRWEQSAAQKLSTAGPHG